MATAKMTDIEVAIRIVPTHLRWPQSGTSLVWTKAHGCVAALQNLVRSVDVACCDVERDRELSAAAINRRRAEIFDRTKLKLANFRPFETAEKALSADIAALDRLSERTPQQVKSHQQLTKAIGELREGLHATTRAVAERCKIRERVPV
jgi:hypothetical protein